METNIFKLLRIETKENFHSRFIAALIENNPDAKKLFFEMLNKSINIFQIDDCSQYKIQNEKSLAGTNGESRADIYITDYKDEHNSGTTRVIIENKIYASDQPEQLYRYHSFLKEKSEKSVEGFKYALFYLTLEGKKPTNYSTQDFKTKKKLNKEDYRLLSYNDHIKSWLCDILISDKINKEIKIYIIDYLDVIRKLTEEWDILERHFQSNENAITLEQKSYLEQKFWGDIEKKIIEKEKGNLIGISDKRVYSYNKAIQCHENKKSQRDYGIIFEFKNDFNIRIAVKAHEGTNFQLFISKGKMDIEKNKWINEEQKDLEYYTNKLENKGVMEEIGEKVIAEILKFYRRTNL